MEENILESNHLSIYLVKDGSEDYFLLEKISPREFGAGLIYTRQKENEKPSWVDDFFGGNIENLYNSSAGLIYKIKVEVDSKVFKTFIISFGTGHHKLNYGAFENRFGLKVILNTGNLDVVRSINKKELNTNPKTSKEQVAKTEGIHNFGLNYNQDMLQSVTLSTKEEFVPILGKTITGGVALSISIPSNYSSIVENLRKIFGYYINDSYKKEYGWIDHVSEVKDKNITSQLDIELLGRLNKDSELENVWLVPPEIIEWGKIIGFSNGSSRKSSIFTELNIEDYVRDDKSRLSFKDIDSVKVKKVYLIDSDIYSSRKTWSLYRCIYTEILLKENLYILSEGCWYEIDKDYSDQIGNWFKDILFKDIGLPMYEKCIDSKSGKEIHSEEKYNKYVSDNDSTYFCLDRNLVNLKSPNRSIEACDLYKNGKFIHVKIFAGKSAPLSHLFNQGLVSTEMFFGDVNFRKEFNKKLTLKLDKNELVNPTKSNYSCVFAIISNKDDVSLPFFSKISMKSVQERLFLVGMPADFVKIKGNF